VEHIGCFQAPPVERAERLPGFYREIPRRAAIAGVHRLDGMLAPARFISGVLWCRMQVSELVDPASPFVAAGVPYRVAVVRRGGVYKKTGYGS